MRCNDLGDEGYLGRRRDMLRVSYELSERRGEEFKNPPSEMIPFARQHIRRLEKAGKYPKRFKIGARRVAWLLRNRSLGG